MGNTWVKPYRLPQIPGFSSLSSLLTSIFLSQWLALFLLSTLHEDMKLLREEEELGVRRDLGSQVTPNEPMAVGTVVA